MRECGQHCTDTRDMNGRDVGPKLEARSYLSRDWSDVQLCGIDLTASEHGDHGAQPYRLVGSSSTVVSAMRMACAASEAVNVLRRRTDLPPGKRKTYCGYLARSHTLCIRRKVEKPVSISQASDKQTCSPRHLLQVSNFARHTNTRTCFIRSLCPTSLTPSDSSRSPPHQPPPKRTPYLPHSSL